MQKKFRMVPFFCLLAPLFLASCNRPPVSTSSSPADRVLLGFSQIGAESAWRTYHSAAIQRAAEEEGVQLLFDNAEQKQENQIKAIRSFIVYRVDVIAFVPIVQEGWDTVLREAKKAGIPVIVCDRKIRTADESLYAAYIGTDSVEEGRQAALFLQAKYADKKGGKPLSILEIRGTDGSSASDGRMQGFHAQLAGDRRFRVIQSENGNFMRSRGREIAGTILKENRALSLSGQSVDILFAANDGMALGFIEVLKKQGLVPGAHLTVVSVDGQQEAVDALKAGEINCVIECRPDMGHQVMETAKRLAAGLPVERTVLLSGQVFTENDDLTQIPDRGY